MSKIRDIINAITALSDWQKEVERAMAYVPVGSCLTATAPTGEIAGTTPAPVVHHDALVLDLGAYRTKRVSA